MKPILGALAILIMICTPLVSLLSSGIKDNSIVSELFPEASNPDFWGINTNGDLRCLRRDDDDRIGFLFGWPRVIEGDMPLWGRSPTVFDIDQNRDLEVAVVSCEGRLNIFQHDGAFYPGFPSAIHYGGQRRPWNDPLHPVTTATGKISSILTVDQTFIMDIGFIHVFDEFGNEPHPFPLDINRPMKFGIPVVADLVGDSHNEIIFNSYSSDPDSEATNAMIFVLDSRGELVEGWPIRYAPGSSSSPAVGDIDRDGSLDIVIGSARSGQTTGAIWAWRSDGIRLNGFPVDGFETIGGSPTLADITGDGKLEILFWASRVNSEQSGIYALNYRGELIDGFPLETYTGHPTGSVAVADVDGDRRPEVAFGTFDPVNGAFIYLWNAEGQIRGGYPVRVGGSAVVGSVILADLSGDRRADVIAAISPGGDGHGRIAAWDNAGNAIEGFPLFLSEWGGGAVAGTPTVWDLNLDGYNDVICVTTDRRMLVWVTPGQAGGDAFPTERGNMARSGLRPADDPRSVRWESGETELPISSQIALYPNPFNNRTTILYNSSISGLVELNLIDVAGRNIGVLFKGKMDFGVNRVVIQPDDIRLTPGIYYIKSNQVGVGIRQAIYLP